MFAFAYTVAVHNFAMKTIPAIVLCFLMPALILLTTEFASADAREDAIFAVSQLQQAGAARYLRDDMNSLVASLADADRSLAAGDGAGAEKLYLLALQKAHVIALLLGIPAPPPPTISEPDSHTTNQQAEIDYPSLSTSEPATGILLENISSTKLIGGAGVYTVISGDTLRLVAAKLGVTRQHLMELNHLDQKSMLKIGQRLNYNNRKIIPQRMREGIIVNIPDRTLYFFRQGNLVKSLPVALGVPTKNEKYIWQTPVGKFRITAKQKDPTWFVPPSIQSEMEERGKEIITSILPGPENPLGKFAIKTSIPGILIHSTTKPWSIYSFSSHGCIRVYPAHMEDFFNEVKVNTQGEIIYKPVKLAVTEVGKIYLEVHRDIYSKSTDLAADARKMVEKLKLDERIDWKKFEAVLRQKSGVAEDITM